MNDERAQFGGLLLIFLFLLVAILALAMIAVNKSSTAPVAVQLFFDRFTVAQASDTVESPDPSWFPSATRRLDAIHDPDPSNIDGLGHFNVIQDITTTTRFSSLGYGFDDLADFSTGTNFVIHLDSSDVFPNDITVTLQFGSHGGEEAHNCTYNSSTGNYTCPMSAFTVFDLTQIPNLALSIRHEDPFTATFSNMYLA